ncbi:MAG: lysylphosphatidylglycerol synthase transmembrane domain-containing protein [Ilumatobacteraceae bacterium]
MLPAVALVALISGFAGLDWADLWTRVRGANWWLVALGFIAAQLPRLAQSLSTLGAAPVPLPLGSVYALQLSTSYINLAVPTTAGRVALNIRFFQRHGVPPGAAIAAGALDGFCGFLVQMMLLAILILFTPASLDVDFSQSFSSAGTFLVAALVIIGLALTVILVVARLRRFVLHWAKQLLAEAAKTLRGLRSPRRLLLLFGGNAGNEILFSVALGVFAAAMSYRVSLGELLLIGIAVSLFSGLMPIPGGIGVAEAGLTWGLVQAGVPDEAAFPAVMLYRLSTFYLPPIWGYVAFNWLRRNDQV